MHPIIIGFWIFFGAAALMILVQMLRMFLPEDAAPRGGTGGSGAPAAGGIGSTDSLGGPGSDFGHDAGGGDSMGGDWGGGDTGGGGDSGGGESGGGSGGGW